MYQSTHTGAQVDEAVDKVLASPISVMSNRNLLDNWFFANPVNQRGQTSYNTNTAYCIDRWRYYGTISMTLQSDGIRLGDTTSNVVSYIRQIIEYPQLLAGRTLTFSVLVKDLAGTGNKGFIRWYASGTEQTAAIIKGELTTLTLTIPSSPTSLYFDIGSYWNNAFTAVAAKLEVGSVSTLANDAPPSFAEELAKCQRYYWDAGFDTTNFGLFGGVAGASGDAFGFLVPTPVPMRVATPTVTAVAHWVRGEGNSIAGYAVTTTNVAIVNGFVYGIGITKTGGFSALKTYWAAISKLTISCDL